MKFSSKTKGLTAALSVSGFQSMESILLVIFSVVAVSLVNEIALAGATMVLKETFSLIFMLVTSSPFLIRNVYKKIRSKQGLQFIIAAVFGTSFGNACFLMAVLLAGSGYGAVLTALYPPISILLLNFVFKEKEPWKVWIGVLLTMFASALFVVLPAVISANEISVKTIVGMLLGGLAAFFWAIEGLFINVGLKGPLAFTNKEVMAIRSLFTAIMSAAVITPITCAFGANAFSYANTIMSTWQSSLLVVATGLNIFFLRMASIYAIRMVGAKITSIVDTVNFVLPAIFTEIFAFVPGQLGMNYADDRIVWWAFLIVIPILLGVFISVYFHKPRPNDMAGTQSLEPH